MKLWATSSRKRSVLSEYQPNAFRSGETVRVMLGNKSPRTVCQLAMSEHEARLMASMLLKHANAIHDANMAGRALP